MKIESFAVERVALVYLTFKRAAFRFRFRFKIEKYKTKKMKRLVMGNVIYFVSNLYEHTVIRKCWTNKKVTIDLRISQPFDVYLYTFT